MAVGVQSFSIREYAAKIRDVDVGKCWPFGGREEEEEERLLPAMVWRKYRWWASELEAARSEDLGAGGGAGKMTAVKDERGDQQVPLEEEGEEVVCVGKATRAPKKRSIAELFAVAPQIEGGGEGDDHEEEEVVGGDVDDDPEEEEEEWGVVEGVMKKIRKEESVEVLMRKKIFIGNNKKTKMMMKKNSGKNKNKVKIKKKHIRLMPPDKKNIMKSKGGKLRLKLKNKEKTHKISLSSGVDISQLVLGSVVKRCGNEIENQDIKRKPAATKNLPKQKKQKTTGTTTSSLKKQHGKSTISIHGILKNQTRLISSYKTNASSTLHNTDPAKLHLIRQPDRRVSFSGKDDILGLEKESCSAVELPPMQNLCREFSDALTASVIPESLSKDNKQLHDTDESRVVVADETHIATIAVVDKTLQTSSGPSELHETNSAPTTSMVGPTDHPTSQEIERTTLSHSVDLNHSLPIYNDLDLLEPCVPHASSNHTCSGSSVRFPKQGFNSATCQSPEGGSSSKHVADYSSKSSILSSMSSMTNLSSRESSPSLTVKRGAAGHSVQWLDTRNRIFNLDSQSHPVCNASQNDMLNSQQPAVVFKRPLHQNNLDCGGPSIRRDPTAIYSEKYINGDFFGLPLNSQGELIRLHSHGILGTVGLSDAQGSISGFSTQKHVEPMQSLDHQKMKDRFFDFGVCGKEKCFFPRQSLFKDQPSSTHRTAANIYPEYPVRDINGQHQDLGRGYDYHAYRLYLEQRRSSCHRCREHDGQRNCDGEKTAAVKGVSDLASQSGNQPTMRLMGKNVTVGKNCKECQCLEDGKVWTDKEIIAEQNPVVKIPDKSIKEWHSQHELFAHPTSETSKRSPVRLLDTSFCHNTSGFYQADCVDRSFHHPHLDCLSYLLPSNGPPLIGSHLSRLDPFIPPQTDALLNKVPKKPGIYISATESMKMFSQLPSASSVPYDACQHILLNSTNSKHSQNPSHSVASAFPHAYMNMDYGNHVQQEFPAQNLQQWLIDAAKHRKIPNTSSYSRPFPDYHPHTISEVNLNHFSSLSPYPPPVSPFPATNQSASRMCLSNLPMTSSLDNSFISHFPMITSNPMMDTSSQQNLNNIDGSKSRFTYVEELDQAKKMRKRPPSKPNDIMKPAKKPNLVILDDADNLTGSRKKDPLHGCIQYTSAVPDFCSHGDKITDVNNNEKDVCLNASKFGSPNLDNGSRSGPVKLSAGAKHILKPSQNTDMDNSRPVYSSIPFAVRHDTGKVHVPQKKSAKIYQF